LYPTDIEDIYHVEAAVAYVRDMRDKVFEWMMLPDPAAMEAGRQKYYGEQLGPMLQKMEAWYKSNPSKASYMWGNSMTVADVYIVIFYSYQFYGKDRELAQKAWNQGKGLTHLFERAST
jgi:hypothetical protein